MRVEAPARAVAARGGKERGSADRRREAIGAAIEVLASRGARGLTHREIDRHLEWPMGSTSNYFRRRTDIFVAIAERIMELDLADLAILDADLARPGAFGAEQLIEHTVHLLGRTMKPAQRSRTVARAEILFEATRNEEVRLGMRATMAVADALFRRVFQQLGSTDDGAAAQFFAVLMSSAFIGMSVIDRAPNVQQLSLLVGSWVAISLDQGRMGPNRAAPKMAAASAVKDRDTA